MNYNELLPVLLTGFICAVIVCIDRYKVHLQASQEFKETKKPNEQDEANQSEHTAPPSVHFLILDVVKNTIYTSIFACFIFWLTLLITENYQIRLGIVGIISILGLDKALSIVEKFIQIKR